MTGAGSVRGFSRRGGASFAGAGFSAATRGDSAGFVGARVTGSLGGFSDATGAGKGTGLAGADSKKGCAASGGGVTSGAGLALGGGEVSGSIPGKPNKRGSILSVGKFVPA